VERKNVSNQGPSHPDVAHAQPKNRAQGWRGDEVARLDVDSGGNFRVSLWHGGSSASGRGGGRRGGGGGKMSQRQEKEAAQLMKTVAVLGGKVLAKLFGEVW
jgi:hypothetical protein